MIRSEWKQSHMLCAGLPLEVTAVTKHAIVITDSMSLLEQNKKEEEEEAKSEWEAQIGIYDTVRHPPSKTPGCVILDMPVTGNDRADRMASKAAITSGLLRLPRRIWSVEELETLKTLPAGTKPKMSLHRSPKDRGVERGSARPSSLKGWERNIV